jgi:hypothetical protein
MMIPHRMSCHVCTSVHPPQSSSPLLSCNITIAVQRQDLATVRVLLQTYPEGASQGDQDGVLPMHFAAESGAFAALY